jgi:hypothetical protein
MWLPEAPQLGIRACQARPLKSFDTRDGLTFESPVVVLGCQDVVDNTSELFGNDGTGNTLVGATQHAFVERSDLRIVLDGPDSTVTERQFEILVTIFVSRFLSECPVGVVGTGDEPAIADEVFVGRETLDAIDLQVLVNAVVLPIPGTQSNRWMSSLGIRTGCSDFSRVRI